MGHLSFWIALFLFIIFVLRSVPCLSSVVGISLLSLIQLCFLSKLVLFMLWQFNIMIKAFWSLRARYVSSLHCLLAV